MGNCSSGDMTDDEKRTYKKSKEIEKIIRQTKIENNFKIIVLGTGDSGKSTFIRQIFSTHGGDKDLKKEKKKFENVIKINCLDSFKALLACAKEHNFDFSDKLAPQIETVLSAQSLTSEVAKTISKMWEKKKNSRGLYKF